MSNQTDRPLAAQAGSDPKIDPKTGLVLPTDAEVKFNLALRRWRQLSRPWWRKHNAAGRNMMRWMYARGGRARRRLSKWMLEYERTLLRMPNPPEHPTDQPPNTKRSGSATL